VVVYLKISFVVVFEFSYLPDDEFEKSHSNSIKNE